MEGYPILSELHLFNVFVLTFGKRESSSPMRRLPEPTLNGLRRHTIVADPKEEPYDDCMDCQQEHAAVAPCQSPAISCFRANANSCCTLLSSLQCKRVQLLAKPTGS